MVCVLEVSVCMYLATLIRGLEPFSGQDPLVDKETEQKPTLIILKLFKKTILL